jgi:UDP:flavonoid glycosyltransferase YjiC (YdhE family)
MGRFLFVTWAGGGNVPPMIGLARLLGDRGHDIRFLAAAELQERIRRAGPRFAPFTTVAPLDADLAIEDQMAGVGRVLAGIAGARDVLVEIEREPTDALVVDCMLFNALCAAEQSGLPTAVLVHLLYEPWRIRGGLAEFFRGPIDEMRAGLGMPPLSGELATAQLLDHHARALVVTPREFDFAIPTLPANARYVGPILDPDRYWVADLPWDPSDPRPLVLASFSSTYMHQEDALARTAGALAALDVRTLVTTGDAVDTVVAPEGVAVRRWVPHAALMPQTSLVVTHAGHATVMSALAHGVPLVCMPMGRDQFLNAQRVAETGAGRTVPADAAPGDIRDAAEEVLNARGYRDAAKRMARVIAAYGSGERAVSELEALL